jgi:hypothetical protein
LWWEAGSFTSQTRLRLDASRLGESRSARSLPPSQVRNPGRTPPERQSSQALFAIQDEIAAAIASALKVTLTGKTDARSYEPNVAAYEAFLKGKHHYYQFSPEQFTRAEQDFTRAIQLGPAVGRTARGAG